MSHNKHKKVGHAAEQVQPVNQLEVGRTALLDLGKRAYALQTREQASKGLENSPQRNEILHNFIENELRRLAEVVSTPNLLETCGHEEYLRIANAGRVYMVISAQTNMSLGELQSYINEKTPAIDIIGAAEAQILELYDVASSLQYGDAFRTFISDFILLARNNPKLSKGDICKAFANNEDQLRAMHQIIRSSSIGELVEKNTIEMGIANALHVLSNTTFNAQISVETPIITMQPGIIASERFHTLNALGFVKEGQYVGVYSDTEFSLRFLTSVARNSTELIEWVRSTHSRNSLDLSMQLRDGLRDLKDQLDQGYDDLHSMYKDIAYVIDIQYMLSHWGYDETRLTLIILSAYLVGEGANSLNENIATAEARTSFIVLGNQIALKYWEHELQESNWLETIARQFEQWNEKATEYPMFKEINHDFFKELYQTKEPAEFFSLLTYLISGRLEYLSDDEKRRLIAAIYEVVNNYANYDDELLDRFTYEENVRNSTDIKQPLDGATPHLALRVIAAENTNCMVHPYSVRSDSKIDVIYVNEMIYQWLQSDEGRAFAREYPAKFVAPNSEFGKQVAMVLHNVHCNRLDVTAHVFLQAFSNLPQLIDTVTNARSSIQFSLPENALSQLEQLRKYREIRGAHPATIIDVLPVQLEQLPTEEAFVIAEAAVRAQPEILKKYTLEVVFPKVSEHIDELMPQKPQPNMPWKANSVPVSTVGKAASEQSPLVMNDQIRALLGVAAKRVTTGKQDLLGKIASDFIDEYELPLPEAAVLVNLVMSAIGELIPNNMRTPINLDRLLPYSVAFEHNLRDCDLLQHSFFIMENPTQLAVAMAVIDHPYEGPESWSYAVTLEAAQNIVTNPEEAIEVARFVFRRLLYFQVHAINSPGAIHRDHKRLAHEAAQYYMLGELDALLKFDTGIWRDTRDGGHLAIALENEEARRTLATQIRESYRQAESNFPAELLPVKETVNRLLSYYGSVCFAVKTSELYEQVATVNRIIVIPQALQDTVSNSFEVIFKGFNRLTRTLLSQILMSSGATQKMVELTSKIESQQLENTLRYQIVQDINQLWEQITALTELNLNILAQLSDRHQLTSVSASTDTGIKGTNDYSIAETVADFENRKKHFSPDQVWSPAGTFLPPFFDYNSISDLFTSAQTIASTYGHIARLRDTVWRKHLNDMEKLTEEESRQIISLWTSRLSHFDLMRMNEINLQDPVNSLIDLLFNDELRALTGIHNEFEQLIHNHPLFMTREQIDERYGSDTTLSIMTLFQLTNQLLPIEKHHNMPLLSILTNSNLTLAELLSSPEAIVNLLSELQVRLEASQIVLAEFAPNNEDTAVDTDEIEQQPDDDNEGSSKQKIKRKDRRTREKDFSQKQQKTRKGKRVRNTVWTLLGGED